MNFRVGNTIRQKLKVSCDKCWSSGIVQYIYIGKNTKGVVYRDFETGYDVFIDIAGREIEVID